MQYFQIKYIFSVVKEKFCAIMCLCVEVLHDVTRIPVDEDPSLQLE
jgi:hypothetical protein